MMGSQYGHEAVAGECGPHGVVGKRRGQDGCAGRTDGNGMLGQGPTGWTCTWARGDVRLHLASEGVGWEKLMEEQGLSVRNVSHVRRDPARCWGGDEMDKLAWGSRECSPQVFPPTTALLFRGPGVADGFF